MDKEAQAIQGQQDRYDKIQLLNRIAAGKIRVKDLQPPVLLEFNRYHSKPGFVFHGETQLTEEQAEQLINETKQRNELTWVEYRQYE